MVIEITTSLVKYLFIVDITDEEPLQTVQTVPNGSRMISSGVDLALQSSVDQVWNLYQMAGETEAKQPASNPLLSQPGSYVSTENNDQKNISEDYSHPSESSPSQGRGQSPKPSGLPNAQLINTPNYVLVNDPNAEKKGNQSSDTSLSTDKERSGTSNNWMRPFLSIFLPSDPFGGDPEGSRPLFFCVTSDQRNVACSPVLVHDIIPTCAVSSDVDSGRECIPSLPLGTQWSINITLKK